MPPMQPRPRSRSACAPYDVWTLRIFLPYSVTLNSAFSTVVYRRGGTDHQSIPKLAFLIVNKIPFRSYCDRDLLERRARHHEGDWRLFAASAFGGHTAGFVAYAFSMDRGWPKAGVQCL